MKRTTIRLRVLRAALWAAAFSTASAGAQAEEFHLFDAATPAEFNAIPFPSQSVVRLADLGLANPRGGIAFAPDAAGWQEAPPAGSAEPAAPPPPPKLFTTATTLVTIGAVLGGVGQGIGAPIHYGWQSFSTTDEGWFGRDTYAGGADKASHFVISSGVSRALYEAYTAQGKTENQSFTLALGTAFMAGTMVELFDAFSVYGWSFQDLTADALGATAGVLIQRNHLDDMLGIRVGSAHTDIPASAVGASEPSLGRSYSDEIYLADLKLGGLITRLNGKPGIARFFLTSFVFYTKGFGYAPPLPTRYQAVGFEFGLNIPEILRAVGVTNKTWWGTGLLAVFDFFRIPFTQIGVYYNMYDNKWMGPAAPYHYD